MKTNKLTNWAVKLGFAAVLAAVSTLNVNAQWTGNIVWNATGNANWSDANWQYNGSGPSIAYINNLPFTFSGSVDSATRTLTVLDGATLYEGMVLNNSALLQWSTNNVGTLQSPGVWSFRENWNLTTGTGSFIGTSDLVARFNNYSGTVTIGGAQYAKEVIVSGGGNVAFTSAPGNAATLFLGPGPDSGTVLQVTDATNVEFVGVNFDNRHIGNGSNLMLRNNGSGTLTFTGGTLASGAGVRFNNNGTQRVTVLNGVTIINNGNSVGFRDGTFVFTGSTAVQQTAHFDIEAGVWQLNAGNVLDLSALTDTLRVGTANGATSAFNIAGKLIVGHNTIISDNTGNTATVTVSGSGRIDATGRSIYIASGGNSNQQNGTLNVTGSGWINANSLNAGNSGGTGYLNLQNSGSITLTDNLNIAAGNSGIGTVTVSDTSYISASSLNVGSSSGDGYLVLHDSGSITLASTLHIAAGNGGTGTVTADGDTVVTASLITLANGSDNGAVGSLTLSGNARMSANYITLATEHTGTAIVILSGNSVLSANNAGFKNIYIGKQKGTAIVNVYDTATLKTENGDIYINEKGGDKNGKATLNVFSGTVSAPGKYIYVNQNNGGNGSSGVLNISGGVVTAAAIVFGSTDQTISSGSNTAILNLTGGEIILTGYNGGWLHTGDWNAHQEYNPNHTATNTQINLGGGKITTPNGMTTPMPLTLTGSNGNTKFSAPGQTIKLNGAVSGKGGLEVTDGTLQLSATNTYTGQTFVQTGATFELLSGAEMSISLAALEADGNRAAFDGEGSLTLSGVVNIDFTSAAGDAWTIFGTNTLAHVGLGSLDWLAGFTHNSQNPMLWTKDNYTFDFGTGMLTIPEPSTWTLLLTGTALLLTFRRRASGKI